MSKKIFRFVTMLIAVLIFCGCTAREDYFIRYSESTPTPEQKTDIRIFTPWSGKDKREIALSEVLRKVSDDYKDIRITDESMSKDDFIIKLKIDFSTGNEPDIIAFCPGYDINRLITSGNISNLKPALDNDRAWLESFAPEMIAYTENNNAVYGLPLEISYLSLYVNKGLFADCGISFPQTYDELKNCISKFRENNITAVAADKSAEGNLILEALMGICCGDSAPINTDGLNNGCVTSTKMMKELYEIGAFPENTYLDDDAEAEEMFLEKKAAMIVKYSSFNGKVIDHYNAKGEDVEGKDGVAAIPFPALTASDKKIQIYGPGDGTFFISEKANRDEKKRHVCLNILREITSQNSAVLFAQQSKILSAVKVPTPSVYGSEPIKERLKMAEEADIKIPVPHSFFDYSEWNDKIIKRLPEYFRGKTEAEELWSGITVQSGILYEKGASRK